MVNFVPLTAARIEKYTENMSIVHTKYLSIVFTFCIAVGGPAITLRRRWRRHKGSGERDHDYQLEDEDDDV